LVHTVQYFIIIAFSVAFTSRIKGFIECMLQILFIISNLEVIKRKLIIFNIRNKFTPKL
jgi:hypothetical protein